MRSVSVAIVNGWPGPEALLNHRYLVDLECELRTGSHHGRSEVWAYDGSARGRREDGLALIVKGGQGTDDEVLAVLRRCPDPAVLVVAQKCKVVDAILAHCRERQQVGVVVGTPHPLATVVEGLPVVVSWYWEGTDLPVAIVAEVG